MLPLSWALTERGESREKRYLAEPLEGFAPTYALEMGRMGHVKVGLDTEADDPQYLKLIDAQVEWLKANSRAASLYTFRKVPGRDYLHVEGEPIQFIVACETDYDRNGTIEGEREQRVPIGEQFDDTDVAMLTVFLGNPTFSEEPVVDRWGTWMSAYAPVFGPDGKVEAAIGVDFDAHEWIAAIRRARATTLAFAGLVVLFIAGGVSVASNQMILQRSRQDREVAELSRVAKVKFETLVNSIEGVVFEWEPAEGRYAFVSAQAERILGRPFAYWLEEKGRWEGHLHSDDREWAIERRASAARSLATYSFEYRAYGPDERIVWIRETGNPVVDAEGKISLLRGVLTDITEQKLGSEELEKTHRQLVDTSRRAGMAEVATGVLHNVGNVLNSVNVASTLIHQKLNGSRLGSLGQLAALLKSQDG